MGYALSAVAVVRLVIAKLVSTIWTCVHFFPFLIHNFILTVVKGKHNLKPKKVIHSLSCGFFSAKAPDSGYHKTSSLIY